MKWPSQKGPDSQRGARHFPTQAHCAVDQKQQLFWLEPGSVGYRPISVGPFPSLVSILKEWC